MKILMLGEKELVDNVSRVLVDIGRFLEFEAVELLEKYENELKEVGVEDYGSEIVLFKHIAEATYRKKENVIVKVYNDEKGYGVSSIPFIDNGKYLVVNVGEERQRSVLNKYIDLTLASDGEVVVDDLKKVYETYSSSINYSTKNANAEGGKSRVLSIREKQGLVESFIAIREGAEPIMIHITNTGKPIWLDGKFKYEESCRYKKKKQLITRYALMVAKERESNEFVYDLKDDILRMDIKRMFGKRWKCKEIDLEYLDYLLNDNSCNS